MGHERSERHRLTCDYCGMVSTDWFSVEADMLKSAEKRGWIIKKIHHTCLYGFICSICVSKNRKPDYWSDEEVQ